MTLLRSLPSSQGLLVVRNGLPFKSKNDQGGPRAEDLFLNISYQYLMLLSLTLLIVIILLLDTFGRNNCQTMKKPLISVGNAGDRRECRQCGPDPLPKLSPTEGSQSNLAICVRRTSLKIWPTPRLERSESSRAEWGNGPGRRIPTLIGRRCY